MQRSKAPFVYCKTIGQQYEPWRPACDFPLFLDPEKTRTIFQQKQRLFESGGIDRYFCSDVATAKSLAEPGYTKDQQGPTKVFVILS